MDETSLYIISRCLRALLYNHTALIYMLYLCGRACGFRPRCRPVIWAVVEARMIMDILVLEVLQATCVQEDWYPLLWIATNLTHTSVAILITLCFEGHFEKTILAIIWTETFAVGCQMGAWVLAYWGTEKMYTMTGQPLDPRDALMPVFYLPICQLCTLALRPLLRFWRGYEFRHPRFWRWFGMLMIFSRVYINIYSVMPQGSYLMTSYLILAELFAFWLVFFLFKQELMRKRVYREQLRSAEAYLALLKEQAILMSKNREQLEKGIALMERSPQQERSELVKQYLTELKDQYSSLLTKVRCRDPLVDALLNYRQILFEEKGISPQFSMDNYSRGCLEEQEVAVLFMHLLDWAMENCLKSQTPGPVSLSASLVKGQFLVDASCSGRKKLTKESLGSVLARHHGMMMQERTEEGLRVRVLLEAE